MEFRILCVITTLLCLATTGLVAGVYYFSLLREELKEIKSLIVAADHRKLPSDIITNLVDEIREENASFIKLLEGELKPTTNNSEWDMAEELSEIKGIISETKADCLPSDYVTNLVNEIRDEHAMFVKYIEAEVKTVLMGKHKGGKNEVDKSADQHENHKDQPKSCDAKIQPNFTTNSDATKNNNERLNTEDDHLAQFESGDNVELIIPQEGGNTALFPGVIMDVKEGGQQTLYNIVKFETSTIIEDVKRKQFRRYSVYPKGSRAYLSVLSKSNRGGSCTDPHIPITIVDYISITSSRKEVSQLHGKYKFTFNGDPTGKINEVRALRVHHFIED